MTKNVLVVDDEKDTRSLVKELLCDEGFDVDEAEDGKICLKRLKKKRFDLILLDIMMPGMTPQEIIHHIEDDARNNNTKISYFSVVEFPEKEKKELLKEKNVVGYIQKPFTDSNFITKVKKFTSKKTK